MKDQSLPLPPSDPGHSADAIAAEIADHLAAAEAELTKHGATTTEAQAAARQKFGDVEKIQKTCYWIQNGETIMLRWTLIALASALCLLLGLSVLGNWRTQSQLAEEMGKLSAELKALAAAKQAPSPAPQPPEITGVIYAGSKDKPVAGASVSILRADGSVVRRATCDEKGVYRSGPLEAGDYFVVTPAKNTPAIYSKRVTQSQPTFVHTSSGPLTVDLDAAYHAGGLKLSVSHDLPQVRKVGKYLISSRINVFVVRSRQRAHPWTAKENMPNSWPVYCYPELPVDPSGSRSAWGNDIEGISPASKMFFLKPGEEREFSAEETVGIFPPDETDIEATLLMSVVPLNEAGEIVVGNREAQRVGIPNTLKPGERAVSKTRSISTSHFDKDDSYIWQSLGGGHPWLSKLKDFSQVDVQVRPLTSEPPHRALIKDRQFTRIVLDIPEGIEKEIQDAVESTTEPDQFEALIKDGFFRRRLSFRVVGYEAFGK